MLSATTKEETAGKEHAHVDLECAEGNKIEIAVPALGVTIEAGAQATTKDGVRYYNLPKHEYEAGKTVKAVTVEATIKNIAVKCTGAFCAFLGGENLTGETFSKDIVTCYEDLSEVIGTSKTTIANYTHGTTPIDCEVEGAPSK